MKNKNYKPTAWKKSRRFGDLKGGRLRNKCKDGIVKRFHSFYPPSEYDKTPIFIIDNPSRDYFFPINKQDIPTALQFYFGEAPSFITHIWFRKHNPQNNIQSYAVGGGGVTAIIFYPLPRTMKIKLGKSKPTLRTLKWYHGYADIYQEQGFWIAEFTKKSVHNYYLERLLPLRLAYYLEHQYIPPHSKYKQDNFACSFTYEIIKLKNSLNSL